MTVRKRVRTRYQLTVTNGTDLLGSGLTNKYRYNWSNTVTQLILWGFSLSPPSLSLFSLSHLCAESQTQNYFPLILEIKVIKRSDATMQWYDFTTWFNQLSRVMMSSWKLLFVIFNGQLYCEIMTQSSDTLDTQSHSHTWLSLLSWQYYNCPTQSRECRVCLSHQNHNDLWEHFVVMTLPRCVWQDNDGVSPHLVMDDCQVGARKRLWCNNLSG